MGRIQAKALLGVLALQVLAGLVPAFGQSVRWRTAVGRGFGGAACAGEEVFLLEREIGRRDVLRVFDLKDGRELHRVEEAAPGRVNIPGSRTAPVVFGDLVLACSGRGYAMAFDRRTRKVLWRVQLERDFGGRQPDYGWCASPLVLPKQGLVVLAPLGEACGLVALDLQSGERVWSTPGLGFSHSTPVLMPLHARRQILMLSSDLAASPGDGALPGCLSSFDPATGRMLWQERLPLTRIPIPPPVRLGGNRLLITGGYGAGTSLFEVLAPKHPDGRLKGLFQVERGAQIHTPVVLGKHAYLNINENRTVHPRARKHGGLACLSAAGEWRWRSGARPNFGRGHVLAWGDQLLAMDGHPGVLYGLRATPSSLQEQWSLPLIPGRRTRNQEVGAPMALGGDQACAVVLVRTQQELICVELPKRSGEQSAR